MRGRTVAVLCDHDLLAAGLAAVLAPAWQVRRVGRHVGAWRAGDVVVVDVDEPRHARVLGGVGPPVVAWTWHADDPPVGAAVTLPKQADAAETRAVLASVVGRLEAA